MNNRDIEAIESYSSEKYISEHLAPDPHAERRRQAEREIADEEDGERWDGLS